MTENYDEGTLEKVKGALQSVGLDHTATIDAITTMQNEGILFREREEEVPPPPAQMTVKAEVEIPLRTVQEAIDTLSRVPWDARLGMVFSGMPEGRGFVSSDSTYNPRITARWDEER